MACFAVVALGSGSRGIALAASCDRRVLLARQLEAADSLYTAAKISVDTTAKDAVAAKAAGMAEAQCTGEHRAEAAGAVRAQDQLPELSQDDVEGLVDGVSVWTSRCRRHATSPRSISASASRA